MKKFFGILALCLIVPGCASKLNTDDETKPATWVEAPYVKVSYQSNDWNRDETQAWVKGSAEDKLVREFANRFQQKRGIPGCAYLLHKDGKRAFLPLVVHQEGEAYRVMVIHLTDEKGNEISFLKPWGP